MYLPVAAHFREMISTYNVKVGEKAVLECDPEGDKPITVNWSANGSTIYPEQHRDLEVAKYNSSKAQNRTTLNCLLADKEDNGCSNGLKIDPAQRGHVQVRNVSVSGGERGGKGKQDICPQCPRRSWQSTQPGSSRLQQPGGKPLLGTGV